MFSIVSSTTAPAKKLQKVAREIDRMIQCAGRFSMIAPLIELRARIKGPPKTRAITAGTA